MQQHRTRFGFSRPAQSVGAILLVVLMLVLGVLSASPSLHHQLHPDSNHPDHFCLITAFGNGQLAGAKAVPVIAAICVFLICGMLLPEQPLVSLFHFCFSPSRAPPRV